MNIPLQTPDPEYQLQEHTRLLQEVRNRYRRNKFEEDLRIFLRIPEKTFRGFMNPQFELLSVVRIKLNGEKEFLEKLQKFLEFIDQTEDLENLEETRKKSSAKVQKLLVEPPPVTPEKNVANKEKLAPNPELVKKKGMIEDVLTHGYSLSSAGYFQVMITIKEAKKNQKRGFLHGFFSKKKEKADMAIIQPHEVMEHLWKIHKKQSSMTLDQIRRKFSKAHIECEPMSKETPECYEPGFIFTADGYCILIDLQNYTASYDPIKPNIRLC